MLGQLFKQRVTLFVEKGVFFAIKCQAGGNIAKGSALPDIASLTEPTTNISYDKKRWPTLSLFTSCHLSLIHATSSKVKQALFFCAINNNANTMTNSQHHNEHQYQQLWNLWTQGPMGRFFLLRDGYLPKSLGTGAGWEGSEKILKAKSTYTGPLIFITDLITITFL